jgi:hypothetical protein
VKKHEDTPTQSPAARLLDVIVTFWKRLAEIFKLLILKIKHLHQQWNTAWLLAASYFALHYVPVFLPEPTHRFFYASVGTVAAHFVLSLMLRLSHPLIFQYLYGLFYNDLYERADDLKSKEILLEKKHTRMKYSLIMVALYLVTWLVLVVSC